MIVYDNYFLYREVDDLSNWHSSRSVMVLYFVDKKYVN